MLSSAAVREVPRAACLARAAGPRVSPRVTHSSAPFSSSPTPSPRIWPGLATWRLSPQDTRWGWPSPGTIPVASPEISSAVDEVLAASSLPWPSLLHAGTSVLSSSDVFEKMVLTHVAFQAYLDGRLPSTCLSSGSSLHPSACFGASELPSPPLIPSFPPSLGLVEARDLPSPKSLPSVSFSAFTMHSMAHIELSAIHLAWDTLVRFAPLSPPEAFFLDFARAADEEARHFGWVRERLRELGQPYGSLPAHLALERGRRDSALSLAARLAVGPCAQEARGLDAGPRLASRLRGHGDLVSAAIVQKIGEEELAHVAIGVHWLRACCEGDEMEGRREDGEGGGEDAQGDGQGADPSGDDDASRRAFRGAASAIVPAILSPPFEDAARRLAGMPETWYRDVRMAKEKKKKKKTDDGKGTDEAQKDDGSSSPSSARWRSLGSLEAPEADRAALARRMLLFIDEEERVANSNENA